MSTVNLNKLLSKIIQNPLIIETGSGGIWTWCKWSDGTAECWGKTVAKSYAMTSTSGNGFYTSDNFTLPSGVFTEVTAAFAERLQGSNDNGLITVNMREVTATRLSAWIQCTVSVTLNISIALYAIGRWK